jgi:hypothetical protein
MREQWTKDAKKDTEYQDILKKVISKKKCIKG